MVTQYDEYHNQRVLCERDWPVQRKYNAVQKAFDPLKMYPPIEKPPTNYGLAQLKEVRYFLAFGKASGKLRCTSTVESQSTKLKKNENIVVYIKARVWVWCEGIDCDTSLGGFGFLI